MIIEIIGLIKNFDYISCFRDVEGAVPYGYHIN